MLSVVHREYENSIYAFIAFDKYASMITWHIIQLIAKYWLIVRGNRTSVGHGEAEKRNLGQLSLQNIICISSVITNSNNSLTGNIVFHQMMLVLFCGNCFQMYNLFLVKPCPVTFRRSVVKSGQKP